MNQSRLAGTHGEVTHQAEAVDWSRETVYDHAETVQAAVESEHSGGPTRAALIQENEDLSQENARLGDWLDQAIEFPPGRQQEFPVTAIAMGLSLNQVLVLLALVMGASMPRPNSDRARDQGRRAHGGAGPEAPRRAVQGVGPGRLPRRNLLPSPPRVGRRSAGPSESSPCGEHSCSVS